MKKIVFGFGSHASGSPSEEGRAAALAALSQTGSLPPALAILVGHDPRHAAEILGGAREVLGSCPLVGAVVESRAAHRQGAIARAGAELFLVASDNLRAKVGVGADGGGWEQEVEAAFRDSHILFPAPSLPESAPERKLYRWYLYRQPSLVLALVISRPEERRSRENQVAAFLKQRLSGRTPILFFSLEAGAGGRAALADERIVTSGVVLTMVKTDLKFSLERFHSFEPIGSKLVITRVEGERIVECNGLPALVAYREATGLDPGAQVLDSDGHSAFSLYPLAHRSRDGRYSLLVPERIGEDGSLRFNPPLETDRVLYPMKSVSSAELWRSTSCGDAADGEPLRLAAALVLRDSGLRDLPGVLPPLYQETVVESPLEFFCGRELKAYLSPMDGEGNAGHLLLAFQRELDPFAVAAAENEQLLQEVVQLKDLHQKIFDSIGYGIAVIDASGRVILCNNTYRALLGGSPAATLEGSACPWSADGTAVCSSCAIAETIEQNVSISREVLRLEEGETHWYRLDTFPLRDEAGKLTAAIEVMRDISAFKNLRFTLESEQRKMEAVLRGMGETLYIVNRRYDLQFFHRGAFPVDVEASGEALTRKCHQALFRRNHPCPWCRMPETLLSGGIERRVSHLADEEGEERSYQITFSPWGVGLGEGGSVVCLLVDISAQKRLEQQMVLSEKLNSLSILSAGMAHELNNPLGAISFNLEILKRRERDQEYQEVLESIRKDVLRINRIVGNLLSFSRSKPASSGCVSLPEIIDASLELFQVVIERRRLEVRTSWPEGIPEVWGNAQDLQQVFVNLIANAVDAMPSGGVIDIAVGLEQRHGQDHGAAIAVVYDNAGNLALLRSLAELPGCDVRFYHGDEEAIDALRQTPATPPEILILDYADANADQVGFFIMMVRECAPEARILVIAEPGGDERNWERFPDVAGVLPRSAGATQMLERVRALVAELRARRRRPTDVVVRFADTGVGIPPELQERIFDPFFTTKDVKGTGLGLSVVHKILENHGASIRVGSSPGAGTHFTLAFPQAQTAGRAGPFRMHPDNGFRGVVR